MPKRPTRARAALRRRAPTLTMERVGAIVALVREWNGQLTWEALCDAVERKTGSRYTRQALHNHLPIQAAYQAYREQPVANVGNRKLTRAQQQIQTLRREVVQLGRVRDALLEKFARWAYNAHTRGLDEDFLDQPLLRISRSGHR